MIFAALEDLGGNRTRAAERLGISIRTLRNKLREYRGDAGGGDDEDEGDENALIFLEEKHLLTKPAPVMVESFGSAPGVPGSPGSACAAPAPPGVPPRG